MIWKIIGVMVTVLVVFFVVGVVYQYVPGTPVKLKSEEIGDELFSKIDYGDTPVFLENLRFNHNDISYFINDSCSGVRRDAMIEAFGLFKMSVENVSFYEVGSDADIDIECSDDVVMLSENLFAAGEGGPSRIINSSRFKIIEKGTIFLYDDPRCNYPIVELHELLHVFGFDHSSDPKSIMYNVSKCEQRITADIIDLINELYSIEALADLRISNLSAVKKGRYLDFNVTIMNDGMDDVSDVNLGIVLDGDVVKVLNIGEIEFGFGRTLRVENAILPSSSYDSIDFYIDKENFIRELDENNNVVRMFVGDS